MKVDQEPSVSIVLHDEHLPVGDIVKRICIALSEEFELKCLSVDLAPAAGGGDALAIGYRLTPRAPVAPTSAVTFADRRRAAHCELMDRLEVPNGIKAISIALHGHWSKDLRAEFGAPASPSTVKRWRSEAPGADFVGRSQQVRATSGECGRRRVLRNVRRHHAIRSNASGIDMRRAYHEALEELAAVNEGSHRFYGRPDQPIEPFGYTTFRRDCIAYGRASCWPARPRRR